MTDLFNWMSTLIAGLGEKLTSLLPLSPFADWIENFNPPVDYLGWLNWFFPVRPFLTIVLIWLAAVAVFYLYSIVMRWIKMIGD